MKNHRMSVHLSFQVCHFFSHLLICKSTWPHSLYSSFDLISHTASLRPSNSSLPSTLRVTIYLPFQEFSFANIGVRDSRTRRSNGDPWTVIHGIIIAGGNNGATRLLHRETKMECSHETFLNGQDEWLIKVCAGKIGTTRDCAQERRRNTDWNLV